MGMASAVPYLLTEESGRSMADSKCNNLNKKEFIDESKKKDTENCVLFYVR